MKNITETKKRVPLEEQFKATNISEYVEEDLVSMVNGTSGDKDFKERYPGASFSRDLAYQYLQRNGYNYVPHGIAVPKGVTVDDLLDLLASHDPKTSEPTDIVVDTREKKVKRTITAYEDVLNLWKKFLTVFPRGYESILITGAMTLLMNEYRKEDGVRITEGHKLRDTKELLKILGSNDK